MPLTSAQLEAIQARGNVIVVAGAGTGKTSTLVERCVVLIERGCSIESILMVTFTEAAAAEMRHRLQLRLMEAAARAEGDPHRAQWWQEQLALLDTARICTLHGFCLQLIRENFHLLGIDPAVKVLDEQQTRPLIEAALDASLEPHLAGTEPGDEAVRDVIRRYGQGEVERIRTLALKLHRYAQSLAAPEQWFAEQRAVLEQEEPGRWRAWLATEARQWAEGWLADVEGASGGAENLSRCAGALHGVVGPAVLCPLDSAVGSGGGAQGAALPALAAALAEILAADAADWPKKLKGKLREPFKKFFEEAEFLASQLESTEAGDGLSADWGNVRSGLRALLLLTQEFSAKFTAAKREMGGLDFADLEQLALKLLADGVGRRSPVAGHWQRLLEHVFVDECQDINAAQDAILQAVSRDTCPTAVLPNRFLVGDVKQSIYQFRLARPELFRGYEKAWQSGVTGRRILLVENFRSAPEIIGFVNALFEPLMRDEVGGVEYEPLEAGRVDQVGRGAACAPAPQLGAGTPPDQPETCPAATERRVEFHLLPKAGTAQGTGEEESENAGEAEDLLSVEREARLVALRLRELHRSGLEIWDKEFKRPRRVEWRDMAVLLRSPANRVEAFAQEFHKCGVPLQAARGGFLQSTEIMDLLSLVRLLDNPLQDIPLLAVLRSPLVALTLDELAEIRAASGAKRFWAALHEFHRTGTPGQNARASNGWGKVDWFLAHFAQWRGLARQVSLSHCLERALAETDYEAVIKAGERGAERAANVRKLVETVRQYDPYQRQGLFRFLNFVEALQAADQDIEPAPAQTQNAVRLMSIHQSKGLEFPVVVVACLGGLFNVGDLHQEILLDEDFGLCAKAVSPASGARHPTLVHWLAARRQRRRRLGEEMRLLYVAATRARDRLLLTATATRKDCESWEAMAPRVFSSRQILTARSPLDWVLLWLPTVTRREDWQGDGGVGELLRWKIWSDGRELELADDKPAGLELGAPTETGDAEAVKRRIRWKYDHKAATAEPAKTTVTVLRKKAAELANEEAQLWAFAGRRDSRSDVPATRLGAAEVGTMHHEFLQRMSITGACDEADLQGQLAVMVEQGDLTPEEVACVDVGALVRFWQSEVGREIRNNAGLVRRELPFTARFTPVELEQITGAPVLPELRDEFVVVQGVADLVVVFEAELWLLDFKTDDVVPRDLAGRAEAYRPQLELYAAALVASYRKPVTRRWLHFLKLGETVRV